MEKLTIKIRKKLGIHIAILGSESTGKSLLAQQLAAYFSAAFIPEFAREHPEHLLADYTSDDVSDIAQKQWMSVKQSNAELLFEDTEQINVKIWMEEVFGFADPKILDRIENDSPDFYLLTLPDIPWIPDPLRVNPGKREYLFELYKAELLIRRIPFALISGYGNERLKNAIIAVEDYLKRQ